MKTTQFAPMFALLAMIVAGASGVCADVVTVRVGVIPVIGAAPLFVANGEGWLKDAGLELSIKTFESGPNIIQAAASGGIDLYVAGVAPLALGRAKGVDLRVITASAVDENVLVGNQKLRSFLQKDAAPANAFRRFHAEIGHAAKIATQPPGSVPAANLQYWLREVAHIDPADVQVVGVGIDATQQAILAGAVDAAIVREPTLTIIQQRNPEIGIIAPGEKLFPGQPGTVVAVYGPFLEKHPQQVQAIVDAILRAIDELQRTPGRTVKHIEAAISKGIVRPEIIETSLKSPAVHFVADPNKIRAPTEALLAYQAKLGVISKTPSIDGLFDTSFYNKAVKARAKKR
jgi:NitT/TauT family transport system substrate-binding protein